MKLAISGCHGRMGQRIIDLAFQDDFFEVCTLLEHKDHPMVCEKVRGLPVNIETFAIKGCDVLIEFTSPEATLDHLGICEENGIKMVIGTTGLTAENIGMIKKASEKIPIVCSSNMSVGVNTVFELVRTASEKLGPDYTVSISEAHHVHKKDAPSGTAKTLAGIIEAVSGKKINDIVAKREGDIVGDHKIVFESAEDILTIDHHAKTRDIFVKGALVAARFLEDKKTGLFNMQDVLGLS